jgi:hypothetical protein
MEVFREARQQRLTLSFMKCRADIGFARGMLEEPHE